MVKRAHRPPRPPERRAAKSMHDTAELATAELVTVLDLVRYAEQEKLAHLGEASGRRAEDWAARPLEP